jgi:hypothetical protein
MGYNSKCPKEFNFQEVKVVGRVVFNMGRVCQYVFNSFINYVNYTYFLFNLFETYQLDHLVDHREYLVQVQCLGHNLI